jgi:hypothetical protein
MNKIARLSLFTSIMLLLMAACKSKSLAGLTPTSEGKETDVPTETEETQIESSETPEPVATLSPSPTLHLVLWQDDFSDINSGWEHYRAFDGVLDYVESEGVYQMQVQAENNLWWVYKDEELPGVTMSVDVWQVGGPEGSLFGLLCRYDPATYQGIVFLISTEGQAGVGLNDQGFKPLRGGELAGFDVINTGLNTINSIEAGCVGETLTMRVNGELLFTLPAGELSGEDIGLAVATVMGAGADVYFDNLTIYQP